MSLPQSLTFGGRVILLAVLFAFSFALAGSLAGLTSAGPAEAPSPLAFLGYSFAVALAVALLAARSRRGGWTLAAAIFLALAGVTTVLHLESLVYLQAILPRGVAPRLFAMGFMQAVLCAPLAVLVTGRAKRESPHHASSVFEGLAAPELLWKFAAIAVIYFVVYYTFGYWVAWQSSAVRDYYDGTDAGGFFAQMAENWRATPWMFPFQMFRGALWAGLTLPLIRLQPGARSKPAVLVGLFFAAWSCGLLLPNPFMPEQVRMAHFVETITSNFLFGGIVGWMLANQKSGDRG